MDTKIGKLTLIKKIDSKRTSWFCYCDCGNTKVIRQDHLRGGRTSSCGKCSHRKYDINQKFFDTIDTEKKAYFLGLLFADGNVDKKLQKIKITLKYNDINILRQFEKCIYYDLKIDHIKVFKSKIKPFNKYATLTIYSTYMANILAEHGCVPKKSLILKYPQISINLQKHFIRGIFDGDGGITVKAKAWTITSTYDVCFNIKKIIIDNINDIQPRIYKYDNVYRVGNKGRFVFLKFFDWLYDDADIYLERKHKLYCKIKNEKCKHFSFDEIKQFVKLRNDGMNYSEIGKMFGRSGGGVRKAILRLNLLDN